MEDLTDFANLNIEIPKKIEDIPETLKQLRAKIAQWNSTFVKAELSIATKDDGSVAVRIRLL